MNYPVCPSHTVVTYTNDVVTGRYLKDPTVVPFLKMPAYLKISATWDPGRKAVGAVYMMDGPTVKKVKTAHAGLIPTGVEHWYVTDIPDTYAGRICRNTVVVHITPDARRLIVFYFTGLEKHDIPERVRFALQVIPSLVSSTHLGAATGSNEGHLSALR